MLSHMLSQVIAGEIRRVLPDSTGDFQKLVPSFQQTSSHIPFSFGDFALCPLAIINLSYVHKHTLSPVNCSSVSLNMGVASRPPIHRCHSFKGKSSFRIHFNILTTLYFH